MIINFSLIVLSFLILFVGAEGLVRGSASLALRAGLTPLMIGLTVVAFGTSSPELVVSLKAALVGQEDIAVGNVVGSNIFNIGIILGLTALICPVPVQLQIIKIDAPIMILVAIILPLMLVDGYLGRLEGGILFGAICAYTLLNVNLARKAGSLQVVSDLTDAVAKKSLHWSMDTFYILGGLGLLVFGSNLLLNNAIIVARGFTISEAVIGLTIIAAGTSMPELATSIVAALRQQPDLAVGNIVGSNIFNISGILGLSSLASPIKAAGIKQFDYAVMIGFSLLLLPLLWSGFKLRRIEGGILFLCYCTYVLILWPN